MQHRRIRVAARDISDADGVLVDVQTDENGSRLGHG